MASDLQIVKTEINGEKFSKLLREYYLQPTVLYPAKLSIKYGGRTFPDVQAFKKFTSHVLCLKNYWRIYSTTR